MLMGRFMAAVSIVVYGEGRFSDFKDRVIRGFNEKSDSNSLLEFV